MWRLLLLLLLPTAAAATSVCLVFVQDQTAFAFQRLWQRWYEDTRVRFHVTKREKLSNQERSLGGAVATHTDGKPISQSVLGHIHLVHQEPHQFDKHTIPQWLTKQSISLSPVHRSPSEIVYESLAAALATSCERSTHFALIPPLSIPLKRGDQIWADLHVDPRSRFTLLQPTHPETHSPWPTLKADDLRFLLDRKHDWVNRPLPHTAEAKAVAESTTAAPSTGQRRRLGAPPDSTTADDLRAAQYWPLRLLQDRYGGEVRYEVSVEPFREPGFRRRIYEAAGSDVEGDEYLFERFIGSPFRPDGGELTKVKYGLLRYLHEKKGVWMMTAVNANATVEGCEMDNGDYYAEWVRIVGGDFYYSQERLPRFAERWYRRPERFWSSCELLSAVAKLMFLRGYRPSDSTYDRGSRLNPQPDRWWWSYTP